MKQNTNIKMLTMNAMLLAIGAILHQITPALGLPMQPDFALAMMLIVVIINKGDYKTTFIAAVITGVFTAMTTKFPGGQLPNVIDKVVTAHIMCIFILVLNKIKVFNKGKESYLMTLVILPIGTLISGAVFLFSAQLIVGLPAPFMILFNTVVLPTVLINAVCGLALHKIINLSLKRSRLYN